MISEFDILLDISIGDLIEIDQFRQDVDDGYLTDYDGSGHAVLGHAVLDNWMSSRTFCPSEIDELPEETTHILWFNR